MYGMLPENYVDDNISKIKNELKVDLTKIYWILLLLSGGVIYFYSVYQHDYLKLLIPYTVIWPISLILVGISIFRVKNTASFSVGFFITSLTVGLTIVSIFVYSKNIKDNLDTKLIQFKDTKQLALNANIVATKATIKSDNKNIFLGDFSSNYDKANISNYKDENKIENIQLTQKAFPPGLGSYHKSTTIAFPTVIPTSFNMKINLSRVSTDLSGMNLISGIFDIQNSQLEMTIKDLDIKDESKLDIKSRLSNIDLVISKDIEAEIIRNSDFSQVKFDGIKQDSANKSIYRTNINSQEEIQGNVEDNKKIDKKKLIINLNSTLSNIRVTQK